MTLKSVVTGVAAAALVGGAAAGVSSVAFPAVSQAQCASPGQLMSVINGLAAPGVGFHSGKDDLVEGDIGIIEGKTADRLLKSAYASGSLPAAFQIGTLVCNPDGTTTADVSANGRSQAVTFVPGGRFGWQLSRGSATSVLSAFS